MIKNPSGVLTIPNSLSAFRMLISPVVIYFLINGDQQGLIIALVLMILAEISDLLDGIAARSLGQTSDIGKLLDPLTDSFYRVSVFLAFVHNGWIPVYMFMIILSRDFIVSYLRVLSQQMNFTLAARSSGKWKAIIQGIAQIGIVVLVIAVGAGNLSEYDTISFTLLAAATLVTAYSLADYAYSVYRSWK
ncbi:MAG: CDP-diacylglycerol--glycerol-3-phosphate 3-phosphatidyltransferase [Methyloligellaceae bacterium]